jgi:hypothetical protein
MTEYIVIFKFTLSTHFKCNGFFAFIPFHLVLIALREKKTHEKTPLVPRILRDPPNTLQKTVFFRRYHVHN